MKRLHDMATGRDIASSRLYPAQAEGDCVAEYLNHLSSVRAKQHRFRQSLNVFWEVEQAVNDRDLRAIDLLAKKRRGLKFAYDYVVAAAKPTRLKQLRFKFHNEGLVLQPVTPEGRAAVALLLLHRKYRLDRIRQCPHCRTWFYARFNHQRFCNNPAKKCQWNHYHTPEWRKQHREQNRKHQAQYRKRLFGYGRR